MFVFLQLQYFVKRGRHRKKLTYCCEFPIFSHFYFYFNCIPYLKGNMTFNTEKTTPHK